MTNMSKLIWRNANYENRNIPKAGNQTMRFWNQDVHRSSNAVGAIGVVGKSGNYTMQAQRSAEKIADAGGKGVDVSTVMLFDVQTLQSAGVPIREENFRFYLDEKPQPTAWLVPIAGRAS